MIKYYSSNNKVGISIMSLINIALDGPAAAGKVQLLNRLLANYQ